MTTDTPRTDACPYCGAERARTYTIGGQEVPQYICGSWSDSTREEVTDFCKEREARQKAKAEVERLKDIVEAQQDELHAISRALGTSEGHSSVEHIVTLQAKYSEFKLSNPLY